MVEPYQVIVATEEALADLIKSKKITKDIQSVANLIIPIVSRETTRIYRRLLSRWDKGCVEGRIPTIVMEHTDYFNMFIQSVQEVMNRKIRPRRKVPQLELEGVDYEFTDAFMLVVCKVSTRTDGQYFRITSKFYYPWESDK